MTRPGSYGTFLCSLLISLVSYSTASAETPAKGLSFGVFPYLPTSKLEQIFAPIAARLSEVTGQPVTLRSRPDFDRFREQVSQQSYDIIFIQPFDYIRAAADNGYQPLACWVAKDERATSCNLKAVIVTRKDSDIKLLDDLRGRRLSAPHASSAVSLLARHALARKGLDSEVEIHSAGNHNNCMQQVITRKSDACATAVPPFTLFQTVHDSPLKIIFKSETIPSSLIAVHDRVPAAVRKQIQLELTSWNSADPAQHSLLHQGTWKRMDPVTDADYKPVRIIWQEFNTPPQ